MKTFDDVSPKLLKLSQDINQQEGALKEWIKSQCDRSIRVIKANINSEHDDTVYEID